MIIRIVSSILGPQKVALAEGPDQMSLSPGTYSKLSETIINAIAGRRKHMEKSVIVSNRSLTQTAGSNSGMSFNGSI